MKIIENSVMNGIIYLIGLFDPYGLEHHHRVADLCVRLLKRCGIKDQELIEKIRKAAMIHDIGKMGVPEYVRRLTGRYLDGERQIMNTHSMHGYLYLQKLVNGVISEEIALLVKHHHENWGGEEGYPDKLHGRDIPYGSRIIRVCDWFDAVTHERGYKRASTPKEALAEMVDIQIEHQLFDPDILRLFLEMMKEEQ